MRNTATKKLFLLGIVFLFLISLASAVDYHYWIEHDTNGNPANFVWVKVDNIPASGTKTIYAIKEPGHSPDGDSTFDFFDDFEGASLDTSKWTVFKQSNGVYSVSNSEVLLDPQDNSRNAVALRSNQQFTTDFIVETALRTNTDTYWDLGIITTSSIITNTWHLIDVNNLGYSLTVQTLNSNGPGIDKRVSGSKSVLCTYSDPCGYYSGSYSVGTETVLRMYYTQSGYLRAEIEYLSGNQFAHLAATDTTYLNDNKYIVLWQGEYSTGVGGESWWDWVRVRKYATNEPTIQVTNMGSYYKIDITNNEATELTDYQIAIPIQDLAVSSSTESIHFTDTISTGGIQITLDKTQAYVGDTVTATCSASNLDDTKSYYFKVNYGGVEEYTGATFTGQTEKSNTFPAFTIPQSLAHTTFDVTCSLYEYPSTFVNSSSAQVTVLNTPPTAPTEILVSGVKKVGNTLTFTASGSTDADGDTITYYFKVYNLNDDTIKQDYSNNNTYLIQQSDAHDTLVIYAKAYDGYDYSDEYYDSITVENSPPVITAVNFPSEVNSSQNISFSVNYTDADGDPQTLEVYLLDGDTILLKRITNYVSGQSDAVIIDPEYWGNQTIKFKLIDNFNDYDENTTTTYVDWAYATFNYLNELDYTSINTGTLSSRVMTIYYIDGSSEFYNDFLTAYQFVKPVDSITFSFSQGQNVFRRSFTLNGGVENKSIYLIDYSEITPVITTLYILGLSDTTAKLELYTAKDGQISKQALDVSSGVDFIMIPNKEYLVRLYTSSGVREMGKIARSYSGVYYLQVTESVLKFTIDKGNVTWGAEWVDITNETGNIRVQYTDYDNLTDYISLKVYDDNNLIYDSENYGYSDYTYTVVNLSSSKTYMMVLTFRKYGIEFKETKYFRQGQEVLIPLEIPPGFFLVGAIFVIVLISLIPNAFVSAISTVAVIVLTLMFITFGWITVPLPLIAMFFVVAVFQMFRGGVG